MTEPTMPQRPPVEEQDRAVYVISVAAELAGVHPQTLRMYERKGLLEPKRTTGRARRYSLRDIKHVRMIQEMTQERGINLAGVEEVMELMRRLEEVQDRIAQMNAELDRIRAEMRDAVDAARRENRADLVPVRREIQVWTRRPAPPWAPFRDEGR